MNSVISIVEKAVNKYVYLQTETVFLEIYNDTIMINWHVSNDNYVSSYRVRQIANFLHKFLPSYVIYDAYLREFKFDK